VGSIAAALSTKVQGAAKLAENMSILSEEKILHS
jgi:hypothetical protein